MSEQDTSIVMLVTYNIYFWPIVSAASSAIAPIADATPATLPNWAQLPQLPRVI